MDVRDDRALHSLAPEWGRVLAALEDGEEADPATLEALHAGGWLVRAAPADEREDDPAAEPALAGAGERSPAWAER